MPQGFISDKKKRILYNKYEWLYIEYKSMASNHLLTARNEIMGTNQKISQPWPYPRNSLAVRVRNRCIETGRARAVFRFCKLSRIKLRLRAAQGSLPGVEKSSW